jgi:hypothetical protein
VYKKMKEDKLELIQKVTKPRYEIAITWNELQYDYFAVRAIWKQTFTDTQDTSKTVEKILEWDISDAIKIQTWPREVIMIIIALLIWMWVFMFRRRKIG